MISYLTTNRKIFKAAIGVKSNPRIQKEQPDMHRNSYTRSLFGSCSECLDLQGRAPCRGTAQTCCCWCHRPTWAWRTSLQCQLRHSPSRQAASNRNHDWICQEWIQREKSETEPEKQKKMLTPFRRRSSWYNFCAVGLKLKWNSLKICKFWVNNYTLSFQWANSGLVCQILGKRAQIYQI